MHAPHDPATQAEDQQSPPAATPEVTGAEPGATAQPAAETSPVETTSPDVVPGRRMIAVADLAAHPGNVREDLALTREFTASIASEGVRVPLLITTGPDGRWRVIEGHRRLAAAVEAGLTEVPCDVDPDRAGDEAGQYLDMALANSDSYRANYRPAEEAAALFAAHEAGATRIRLRKATGRTAAEVRTALAAGSLPAATRARAAEACEQVSLDDLALLAEFDGDPDATDALVQAIEYGYPLEHTAQRIRHQKAEAAEHSRIRSDLEAAGITVTSELPPDAQLLDSLLHDGEVLTPESHAGCPGRAATFRTWALLEPVHYCATPAEHGHASRWASPAHHEDAAAPLTVTPDPLNGATGHASDPPAPLAPDRRLVVTGNKAWAAATVVRHRWITESLLGRRTASREVHEFLTRQLLAMPLPLFHNLPGVRSRSLFTRLAGNRDTERLSENCGTATTGRLAILALIPVIAAYEQAMTEGEGRNTWRTDRHSPCPRTDAATYLTFLAGQGYQLSDIEQAVADGLPYTGISPLTAVLGETPWPSDHAHPGDSGPDEDGAGHDETRADQAGSDSDAIQGHREVSAAADDTTSDGVADAA